MKHVREGVLAARERQRRRVKGGGDLPLPGLCLPKALTPLLPVYLQCVLTGATADAREGAADGLGELVEVTGEVALKPFVIQITGPLIRVVGDKFPWQVKAAILKTLAIMIRQVSPQATPEWPFGTPGTVRV